MKDKLTGTLEEIGIPYEVDFTNADPEAHTYAVTKLTEKFGPKGKCTLLDYLAFYSEKLTEVNK